MTRRAALWLLALGVAGCVHYPTAPEVGGIRIRPHNGHAIRHPTGLVVFMDLDSTGKYGDTLVAVLAPGIAKTAMLLDQAGKPVSRLDVPGETQVKLFAEGPHIVLTDLTRAPVQGEVLLLTLVFEKIGNVGAITRIE